MSEIKQLEESISRAMIADQFSLRRMLNSIRSAQKAGKPFDRNLGKLKAQLEKSNAQYEKRLSLVPEIDFELDLPILERRDEIAAAIAENQVIVVCGETGSGKSTQLPKIALSMGRGVAGMIGHTQPRRIAARSVAARLADEVGTTIGDKVGFRIRFNDQTGPNTFIKLMTDGILLAESQSDRYLDRYDTIIIDEAHERSLNIDILIGYIKQLLVRRRDLKLIITSATIDAERFSEHFYRPGVETPIIEVSGRTFPVETRYRPLVNDEGDDHDWPQGVINALEELATEGRGDTLVFLPTERDIRELTHQLGGHMQQSSNLRGTEVLPLYGRMSTADQNKVFQSHNNRRVVLATNVAESSLTVPGIRYVIDTGTARISRYSVRTRMQRLPIEPVSQASANQRKGRCGRVAPGIAIRLFDEADFDGREEFTPPEIQRTSLAAVLLQMMSLKLGAIEEFPFLDPPKPTAIKEGYKTLFELGALDEENRLTDIGRQLSRMPTDPRIGRMIIAGIEEHCLPEVLIIASALEVQDPRDRPTEKRKLADEAHQQFVHEESDFLGLLKIWDFFHNQRNALSQGKLRKACKQNFLSYNRLREWSDLQRQLRDIFQRSDSKDLKSGAKMLHGKPLLDENGDRKIDYAAIHRALLTGLLSNIAFKSGEQEYSGAGGHKLHIWPGAGIFKAKPKWIVGGELVETSRRYIRMVAKVNPDWIESLAEHLVKRTYSEPHWHEKSESVMAWEKVALLGMPIVARRRVRYGNIDPVVSREMFIRHAFIEGDLNSDAPFLIHNKQILAEAEDRMARSRKYDLMLGEESRIDFYDERLPPEVCDGPQLHKWRKKVEQKMPRFLFMDLSHVLRDAEEEVADEQFPAAVDLNNGLKLKLDYALEPGTERDGITVTVPREALNQVDTTRLGWLVPGLVEEKIVALIKSMPKSLRRTVVPAPDTARAIVAEIEFGVGNMEEVVAGKLSRISGEPIRTSDFDLDKLPNHLRMNIAVVDAEGEEVVANRDIEQIRSEQSVAAAQQFSQIDDTAWTRSGITKWDIEELPESVTIESRGLALTGYPGLEDAGASVSLRLFDSKDGAELGTRVALVRLVCLSEAKRLRSQAEHFPGIDRIRMFSATIPGLKIGEQLSQVLARMAFVDGQKIPRSMHQYTGWYKQGLNRLGVVVQDLSDVIGPVFEKHHALRMKLAAAKAPQWAASIDDMRQQLDRIVDGHILTSTPFQWLKHIPRYFDAVDARLVKLAAGGLKRDHQLLDELEHWQQWMDSLNQDNGASNPEVVQLRWMIEEYRVSLFAQQLGTAMTISARRLEKQLEKINR